MQPIEGQLAFVYHDKFLGAEQVPRDGTHRRSGRSKRVLDGPYLIPLPPSPHPTSLSTFSLSQIRTVQITIGQSELPMGYHMDNTLLAPKNFLLTIIGRTIYLFF